MGAAEWGRGRQAWPLAEGAAAGRAARAAGPWATGTCTPVACGLPLSLACAKTGHPASRVGSHPFPPTVRLAAIQLGPSRPILPTCAEEGLSAGLHELKGHVAHEADAQNGARAAVHAAGGRRGRWPSEWRSSMATSSSSSSRRVQSNAPAGPAVPPAVCNQPCWRVAPKTSARCLLHVPCCSQPHLDLIQGTQPCFCPQLPNFPQARLPCSCWSLT